MTSIDVYITMSGRYCCRFASLERERRCEMFDETSFFPIKPRPPPNPLIPLLELPFNTQVF